MLVLLLLLAAMLLQPAVASFCNTTQHAGIGVWRDAVCYEAGCQLLYCKPGHELSLDGARCDPCPAGYYNPHNGSRCIACSNAPVRSQYIWQQQGQTGEFCPFACLNGTVGTRCYSYASMYKLPVMVIIVATTVIIVLARLEARAARKRR